MTRLAKERGVNRKKTSTLKGLRQSLDSTTVPMFDWYYVVEKAELYHYDKIF